MTIKKKLLISIALLALPIAAATGFALRAEASNCACGAACACDSCNGDCSDCGDCAGGCAHPAP